MKRIDAMLVLCFVGIMFSCQPRPGWTLTWEEEFNVDGVIDDAVWSKIPRGTSDWNRHMSDYDPLYDVKEGNLILRGIRNPGIPGDSVPYITGGIFTKDKLGFHRGRIEISARFEDAQGAWPAFWLLPFDNQGWPHGGELDIMERLNGDSVAHQNVHSYYTKNSGQREPVTNAVTPINHGEYNTYGVDLYADSVVFTINGRRTFNYPRIKTDFGWQFPFDQPYYLLLDMQLGGSWVGEVNVADLPVALYIDWVRFYEWK